MMLILVTASDRSLALLDRNDLVNQTKPMPCLCLTSSRLFRLKHYVSENYFNDLLVFPCMIM